MIIGTPYIKQENNRYRLISDIQIDSTNQTRSIWIEVDEQWKDYLCTERGDAYLVMLLPLAMIQGEDIQCNVAITEELLYNIENYLVPALVNNSKKLYFPSIVAETANSIENVGAVGTGMSCGIDSFHAVYNHINPRRASMRLTHLCVFHQDEHTEINDSMFEQLTGRAKDVANDLKLPLVVINSNVNEIMPVPSDFNFLHGYSATGIIYALQKLWGTYYYASGYDYSEFKLENAEYMDCSHYELLSANCFSTRKLRIYSEGGPYTRYQKTERIAKYDIVQKYLKVCAWSKGNCSKCGKCRRTMLTLDVFDELRNYSNVFDTGYYYSNKDEYYEWLYKQHAKGDIFNEPTYQSLKDTHLMKEIINKNTCWNYFYYASGIYDDCWLNKTFVANSHTGEKGKMILALYISDLTPKNQVTITIDHEVVHVNEYTVGLHEIELDVKPSTDIEWSIAMSEAIVPAKQGNSDDIRQLSLILNKLEFI